MKHLSRILLLCAILCFFVSCKQEQPEIFGRIYGFVIDKNTGNPIYNAIVEIKSIGKQSATGTDGGYEITNLKEGNYKIIVTKSGYKIYTYEEIVIKGSISGKEPRVQHDVILEPLPPALTILDDKQQKIDIIDFGSDYDVVMRTFNIFNDSEDKLTWQISYKCDWIDKITPDNGSLKANGTQSVVISIDRNKLQIGDNQTIVHITSDNGSKEIVIKASSINVIETKNVSSENIDSHFAVLKGKVLRDLYPSITEYGFVYSISQTPTLDNGAFFISNSGKPQIGEYNMKVEGLEKETTYYVRAYVKNEKETIYGNQIQFKTISHVPQISISKYSPIETTAKAISNIMCVINADGGLPLDGIFLCWGEERYPTINGHNVIKVGDTKQNAPATIDGLKPNTKYYVRAYAKNAEEEAYSDQIEPSTLSGLPIVGTISIIDMTSNSFTCSCNVQSQNGAHVIEKGLCWSNDKQTLYDNKMKYDNNEGLFSFTINDEALNFEINTYYVCGYAINEFDEIVYGQIKSVTANDYENIKNAKQPTVRTFEIQTNDVYTNSFICRAEVLKEGEASVTEKGFCWNTIGSPNCEEDEHISCGIGIGTFSKQIIGVNPLSQTYYIRAYAKNEYGISYGEEVVQSKDNPYHLQEFADYYMIYPYDLGEMDLQTAISTCENLDAYGFNDWRLPTMNEALIFQSAKNRINYYFTKNVEYWTSTFDRYLDELHCNLYYTVEINCNSWSEGEGSECEEKLRNVRPIRLMVK